MTVDVKYNITVTLINLISSSTSTCSKEFTVSLTAFDDTYYNNDHVLVEQANMIKLFHDEIEAYSELTGTPVESIDIDEFEIVSMTDNIDVYFADDGDTTIPLTPVVMCYVHPKFEPLKVPKLVGIAYDAHTIIWTWPEDMEYAHMLVDEAIGDGDTESEHVIANIGIGARAYTETGLEPDTAYTRRLINYTADQTSAPSASVTVRTETVKAEVALSEYNIAKNYDFTSDDSERESINDNLEAFHAGIGDFNDLKVYKQMDADFYQKFKAYFEITGRRAEREKRYEQVGFNYKVCLEAIQEINEQEGEVTFSVDVYPREWVRIHDYIWNTWPVRVKSRLSATVFLRKEDSHEETSFTPNVWKPVYEDHWEPFDPPKPPKQGITETKYFIDDTSIIISIDMSGSMATGGLKGYPHFSMADTTRESIKELIDYIEKPMSSGGLGAKDARSEHDIEYVMLSWASGPGPKARAKFNNDNHGSAPSVKKAVENWLDEYINDAHANLYTNHWAGLNAGWGTGPDKVSYPDNTIQIFITDGFANIPGNMVGGSSNWCYTSDGKPHNSWDKLLKSIRIDNPDGDTDKIKRRRKKLRKNTYCVFMTDAEHYDEVYDRCYNGSNPNPSNLIKKSCELIAKKHQNYFGNDHVKFGENIRNNTALVRALKDALDVLIQEEEIDAGEELFPGIKEKTKKGNVWHWTGAPEYKWYPKEWIEGSDNWRQNADGEWEKLTGQEFAGWEEVEETALIPKYNLDDIIELKVTVDLPDYVFSSTPAPASWITGDTVNVLTPVEYDREARRAVIPSSKTLTLSDSKSVICNDMFTLIINKVKEHPYYVSGGYTKPIGFSSAGMEAGMEDCEGFLIRGCTIQNTYSFDDGDTEISSDWGIGTYEDGLTGSVNVFSEIDKLGTIDYYGDDCYVVKKDKKIWITGYTDAIIFDTNKYLDAELNSYDNPSKIVFSGSTDYSSELKNRKNNSVRYSTVSGTNIASHCLEVIGVDNDIVFESNIPDFTGEVSTGEDKYFVFDPVLPGYYVIAKIDKSFFSPVLNYRFNLEDPDARTPLYEILPDCDPYSSYLNIVILKIYYAKNVYVTNTANYIESFGTDPIATRSSTYKTPIENVTKWTLKEWKDGADNGWYIDNYLWFYTAPMVKIIPYYDELPGEGMDSYYGLVNGRYRDDTPSGKQDLRVQTHKFNIPDTVTDRHSDSIRIYIMVEEFYPDDALVYYKWDHPFSHKDSITQVNGDYVTFSSDTVTIKDVDYDDIIETINYENMEVFDSKTVAKLFDLKKPETVREYEHYYLRVQTDNSDVLAMRYPTEIVFDEDGNATVSVSFKGVVNATSKWSPIIHNGYYYLNQHEHYAYSEFDVDANFETEESVDFKTISGYVSINVQLRHVAGPSEHYKIEKSTRSELIQDEEKFTWVNEHDADGSDEWGLTLRPYIDGVYYKDYYSYIYTSPQIFFPHTLTTAGKIHVEYYYRGGSTYLPDMEVRSYNIEDGTWSEWVEFANDSVPLVPLSTAYQVRFLMQASTTDVSHIYEDYMCCHLDWMDDADEANLTNIVTITDHMTTGPDNAEGIYISKIIDYGCETEFLMDIYESHYRSNVQVFVACSNDRDTLLLERIAWEEITGADIDMDMSGYVGRYFRYMLKIPANEKVYWLHKKFNTVKTDAVLPYLKSISMEGDYVPVDIVDSFINVESFELVADGNYHTVINRLRAVIGADVLSKGFTEDEIEYVTITSTTDSVFLKYNTSVELHYPTTDALDTAIEAMAMKEYEFTATNTPFIFAEKDYYDNDMIFIHGTPQQFCPITVENSDGEPYVQLFENSDLDFSEGFKAEHMKFMILHEHFVIDDEPKYIELKRNDYELSTLEVKINGVLATEGTEYDRVNHLIIFKKELENDDTVDVQYRVKHSFIALVDREEDTTLLYLYTDIDTLDEPVSYRETEDVPALTADQFIVQKSTFSHGVTTDSEHIAPSEEYHWVSESEEIKMDAHTGSFNGAFIDSTRINIYHLEVTIRSTVATDGLNGIIVGYAFDPWGDNHTLSLVVTRGGIEIDGPVLMALIYDYQRITQKVISRIDFSSDSVSGKWSDLSNGIKLVVDKNENMLTCKASYWNNPGSMNPSAVITYDLNSDDETSDFSKGVYYGFCSMMQKDSFFKVNSFTASTVIDITKKFKVFFETSKRNNKFVAKDLSLNPIYRTDYSGFIYLTDEHNEPYSMKIYCNPTTIKAGGYDKIDMSVEVLDIMGNPVIHKPVAIDCENGILYKDSEETDMNGVIHWVYESSYGPSVDTVTAKVLLDDGSLLEESVTITNEA